MKRAGTSGAAAAEGGAHGSKHPHSRISLLPVWSGLLVTSLLDTKCFTAWGHGSDSPKLFPRFCFQQQSFCTFKNVSKQGLTFHFNSVKGSECGSLSVLTRIFGFVCSTWSSTDAGGDWSLRGMTDFFRLFISYQIPEGHGSWTFHPSRFFSSSFCPKKDQFWFSTRLGASAALVPPADYKISFCFPQSHSQVGSAIGLHDVRKTRPLPY